MTAITMTIVDQKGQIKEGKFSHDTNSQPIFASGKDFVQLGLQDFRYENEDEIKITVDRPNTFLMVKLDETLDSTLIYIKDEE